MLCEFKLIYNVQLLSLTSHIYINEVNDINGLSDTNSMFKLKYEPGNGGYVKPDKKLLQKYLFMDMFCLISEYRS